MNHIHVLEQHIEELDRTIAYAMNHRHFHIVNELSAQLVSAIDAYDKIVTRNKVHSEGIPPKDAAISE